MGRRGCGGRGMIDGGHASIWEGGVMAYQGMSRRARFAVWISERAAALLGVRAVPVGVPGDGLTRPIWSSGTEIDKPWHELYQEVGDAREAWRQNPLAKRLVSMVTAYVVGGGIQLRSSYAPLDRFIRDFVETNDLDQVLDEWCDELSRAGELFPVLFTNPAEGNPNSDDSAAVVLEAETWVQVAELVGKVEPGVFAGYVGVGGAWYNGAEVMVERNNHGHLVIRALREDGRVGVLAGYDGRLGWLSNVKGKPMLYGVLADAVRDGACVVRSRETAGQIGSIEASTLRAPEGLHDDRADAYALAVAGVAWRGRVEASAVAEAGDPVEEYDASGGW